jgi:tetratricopeptide (TPR) repeat protein
MRRLALFLALLPSAARAGESGDEHMLEGARYFQAQQFTEALVEFRVAEHTGDAGASWYVASTLVKLHRPEDALDAFERAETAAARDRDALFDYYHALACYDARLYFCADHLLSALGEQTGPRIAAQARQIRAELAHLISTPPSTGAIDWYHARAQAALGAGRAALARSYYGEASSLAALRSDGYRRKEALAGLARARARVVQAGAAP